MRRAPGRLRLFTCLSCAYPQTQRPVSRRFVCLHEEEVLFFTKEANGVWKLSFVTSMMIASLTEYPDPDKDTLLPQSYSL